jgi:hypothetical protein
MWRKRRKQIIFQAECLCRHMNYVKVKFISVIPVPIKSCLWGSVNTEFIRNVDIIL